MSKDVKAYNYYIRSGSSATEDFAKTYFLDRINQRQIDFPEYLWLATVYNLRDNKEYLVISSELVGVMSMSEADRWVVKGGDAGALQGLDISSLSNDETFIEDLATEVYNQAAEVAPDPLEVGIDMEALATYLLDDPQDRLTNFVEDLIQNHI